MSDSLRSAVRLAVLRLLDPLVKWLLEAGVGVGDLLSLVKIAYVRAAREQGLASGGERTRPNASRISVVTGLTRAEVANILAAGVADPVHYRGRQRAERVLSGWWNDPSFQEPSGRPALLPVRGSKRSLAALVERYSGERWRVATILEELLRVKAIRRLPDGRLEALSRSYATVRWDPDGVTAFGEHLGEYCATLLHNLNFPARARYVRRVINARLDPRYVPMLVRDLEHQAKVFADSADDALNDPKQTVKGREKRETASLGIAIYVFESVTEPENPEPPKQKSPLKRPMNRSAGGPQEPRHRYTTRGRKRP
jgi:hypothetical protein